MTVGTSRRIALAFATFAVGAIALAAPAALAAVPMNAKPEVQSAARGHAGSSTSTLRVWGAPPQRHVEDPFASLVLE
jgi:hypothetical protein